MAGFTINGCGASDSYYTIKELSSVPCRRCKKSDMALMELRMKIRIVYIPTFTIGKKYAVLCPKCKQGFYVDDAQRTFILNHDSSCVQVTDEGVVLIDDDAPAAEPAPQSLPEAEEAPAQVEEAPAAPAVPEAPSTPRCQCGAELIPGALFCMKCGARVKQESAPAPAPVVPVTKAEAPAAPVQPEAAAFVYKKPRVCPECGMHVTGQKDTCSICGAKIV